MTSREGKDFKTILCVSTQTSKITITAPGYEDADLALELVGDYDVGLTPQTIKTVKLKKIN